MTILNRDGRVNIEFDRVKLTRLKAAYDNAVKNRQTVFVFDDCEYLVRYAFYLIQHLETELTIRDIDTDRMIAQSEGK